MKKIVVTLLVCGLIAALYGWITESPRFITGGLVLTACMAGTYTGNSLKEPDKKPTETGRKRRLLYGVLMAETLCLAAMLTLIATSATGHTDFPFKLILLLVVSSIIVLISIGYILYLLRTKY